MPLISLGSKLDRINSSSLSVIYAWLLQNNKTYDGAMDLLKTIYMQGYAAGFQSKVKYLSQEQLQK